MVQFLGSTSLYQQSLAILWNKFDTYDRANDFGTWARGVARFEVANFLKKKRGSRVYFSDTLIAEVDHAIAERETEEHRGIIAVLRGCVKKLNPIDRELIQAFYDGVPAKVLAERGKRSVEGVYNALGRIRRTLSDCVRRTVDGEDHK